jgi:tRNA nucleotidyltransferase (CCA-adding enzyme)
MKIYEVGGAVRDALLGLPVESDWGLVAHRAVELEALGFRRVGKDFPVFLHPRTGAEYALARTERKTAPDTRASRSMPRRPVTLEDDLKRRDLTINAIARTEEGKLSILVGPGGPDCARAAPRVARPFARIRCACCASHASPRVLRRSDSRIAPETVES